MDLTQANYEQMQHALAEKDAYIQGSAHKIKELKSALDAERQRGRKEEVEPAMDTLRHAQRAILDGYECQCEPGFKCYGCSVREEIKDVLSAVERIQKEKP